MAVGAGVGIALFCGSGPLMVLATGVVVGATYIISECYLCKK